MPKDSTLKPATSMLPARLRSSKVPKVKEELESILDETFAPGKDGWEALGMRDVRPNPVPGFNFQRKAEDLEKRVHTLKQALARMRTKLDTKSEQVLDLKAEVQGMKKEMEVAEQESDQKDELLDAARKDTDQYRTWWLNEIQFMKLMLNKVPEPNRDIDLVRTAQAHYLGHY